MLMVAAGVAKCSRPKEATWLLSSRISGPGFEEGGNAPQYPETREQLLGSGSEGDGQ